MLCCLHACNKITSCQNILTGLWVMEFTLTDDQEWLRPELNTNWLFAQTSFPASRGLSRQDKLKGEERDLCRIPTSFLSCMPSHFLNNQWRFCHVWHNPENRFEFECEREWLLNLSVRSNFKWTNQNWRWSDLASGCCRGAHYKSLRKAEEVNIKANFLFFSSPSTGEARVFGVKFIGLYGTVGFIAIQDFSFWAQSDLWSDVWPVMDGVVSLLTEVSHDDAKMKDLP